MATKLGNGKLRKDQTDHYGRVKHNGEGGATVDDFVDSETIVYSEDSETGKVKSDIAAEMVAKIDNSLQTPLTTPLNDELVGINTEKQQTRVKPGRGLIINGNSLEVVSVGYSNASSTIQDNPIDFCILTQSEYDNLTTKLATRMYIIVG